MTARCGMHQVHTSGRYEDAHPEVERDYDSIGLVDGARNEQGSYLRLIDFCITQL